MAKEWRGAARARVRASAWAAGEGAARGGSGAALLPALRRGVPGERLARRGEGPAAPSQAASADRIGQAEAGAGRRRGAGTGAGDAGEWVRAVDGARLGDGRVSPAAGVVRDGAEARGDP